MNHTIEITGLARPSRAMMSREVITAETQDEIDRIASDYLARPEVELVAVTPPREGQPLWRAEVYASIGAPTSSDVVVSRDYVERLMRTGL